jgi:hypothetical protein
MVSFFKLIKLRFVAYLTLSLNLWPSFRTTSYEFIPHYHFTGLWKQDLDYINIEYVNHLAPFRSQANAVYTLGKSFTIIHRVSYYMYIYIYIYICMQVTPFRENILVHHTSTSITLNRKETVHIYLFLFTFYLRGIIDIVRIQCKA